MDTGEVELTDLERANIRVYIEYGLAKADLERQKKLFMEIEDCMNRSKRLICSAISRYDKVCNELKKLEAAL